MCFWNNYLFLTELKKRNRFDYWIKIKIIIYLFNATNEIFDIILSNVIQTDSLNEWVFTNTWFKKDIIFILLNAFNKLMLHLTRTSFLYYNKKI